MLIFNFRLKLNIGDFNEGKKRSFFDLNQYSNRSNQLHRGKPTRYSKENNLIHLDVEPFGKLKTGSRK